MIRVIISNLYSDGRDITEARTIGQHPMHDDGDFARQRHFGLLHATPPGDFIAQLFNAVQPLSGLVSMMLAAWYRAARTHASPIFEMRPSISVWPDWYLVGVRPK